MADCGTYTSYCQGCHCYLCKQASNEYQRKAHLRKVIKLCGPPPWVCHFCSEAVDRIERGYSVMHHLDHDHSNDIPENTAVVHKICHDRHHRTRESFTPEWREKISEAKKRQWQEGIYDKVWDTRKSRYGSSGTGKEGAK